jgi:hypothetical protein
MNSCIHLQTVYTYGRHRHGLPALLVALLASGCASVVPPSAPRPLTPRLQVLDALTGEHQLLDVADARAHALLAAHPARLELLPQLDLTRAQLNNVSIPRLLGSGNASADSASPSTASRELHP